MMKKMVFEPGIGFENDLLSNSVGMLFNSPEFLFAFLPITLFVYFSLTHNGHHYLSKAWLLVASLFFYGWWNPGYLTLIVTSIAVNYFISTHLIKAKHHRKLILISGIVFNLGLLCYYKYVDFFIANVNAAFGYDFNLLHIILPLGISFITFQKIGFLVDSYKRKIQHVDPLYFAAFVTFFPQLVAGPIVHHQQLMPQLEDKSRSFINADNVIRGIFLFNMGLAKKIIIADTFGKIANNGYANYEWLDGSQAWFTAIAYSIQLYFDFSGYSDMAIGLGLLFNIELPVNFNSPYKSSNIQEFWRRWHITLSTFMRNYIYIPLGGNKDSEIKTNLNLILTFLIGGFWHGANWTFVVWGALNGGALVVHRQFQKLGIHIHHAIGVAMTFFFILITWVFFRSPDFTVAWTMLSKMFGGADPSRFSLITSYYDAPIWIAGIVLLFVPNAIQLSQRFRPTFRYAGAVMSLLIINLIFINSVQKQDFLYFDF